MKFRVTWIDTETGESHGLSVSTLHTARKTCESLQRASNTKDVVLSIVHARTFNDMHISYR